MKVSCPNCNKAFNAPNEWAGRQVKCPGCKGPVTLPRTEDSGAKDLSFDLGSLASVEQVGEVVVREKAKPVSLKEAQAIAATAEREANGDKPAVPDDPFLRTCPGCGQQVRSAELYSDIICRLCGAAIPGQEINRSRPNYSTGDRIAVGVKFYSGFTSAVFYPIPALGSIGLGMGIALAAIAVPLFPILAFTGASSANGVNKQQADFGWVGTFLSAMFVVEAIYFGAVAYYALIDTIRTTSASNEQPPPLTWAPAKLGGAMGGYAALLGFYALVVCVLIYRLKDGMPGSMKDLDLLFADPASIIVLALMTFSVPMNMVGLSSTQSVDGLNPIKFGPSIGKTIGHYTFLFLIIVLYLGFSVGMVYAVMNWAGPMLLQATQGGKDGLAKVMLSALMGLAAWATLIGMALWFAYSMGRILGLFARTFRAQLTFEI